MMKLGLAFVALAFAPTVSFADDLAAITARIDARAADIRAAAPVPILDGRVKVVDARRVERKFVMVVEVVNPNWEWKSSSFAHQVWVRNICPQANQDELDAGFSFQIDAWDDLHHFISSTVVDKNDCGK